jgi:hypothetical protein
MAMTVLLGSCKDRLVGGQRYQPLNVYSLWLIPDARMFVLLPPGLRQTFYRVRTTCIISLLSGEAVTGAGTSCRDRRL